MYRRICSRVSCEIAIWDGRILSLAYANGLNGYGEGVRFYELSPDGAVLSEAPIPEEHLQTLGLDCGQCMVAYNDRTRGQEWLTCFSQAGEALVSIGGLAGYPRVLPRGASEYYLLRRHLFSYNSQTLQHEDLGLAPWDLPLYRGACGGLHFLTEAWQTRLLALRDLGGRGLEEVWRLDLAERDRHVGWQGPVPGQVNFLNLYGDGVWATSHKRTYRLDAATGRVLEVRDYLLPEFLVAEGIGHALRLCAYQRMDMARGILLRNSPVEKFAYQGREYHCDFKDLCLHDGLLYVSVALWNGGGLHLLAAFDTQAERFVWHDAWGGCSLDSVHIVGDRLIACDGDEVRIYARE